MRRQDGLTLTEVLIAAALLVVVLLAALAVFDGFGGRVRENGVRSGEQDAGRRAAAQVVRDLRAASADGSAGPLARALPSDVVFSTRGTGAASSGTLLARVCADPEGRRLWSQRAAAGVSTLPSSTCPDLGWGEAVTLLEGLASEEVFAFDASAPDEVRSVRISLVVDSDPNTAPGPVSYETAATLRNAPAPPAADPDFTASCSGGQALLQADLGIAAGRRVRAEYSQNGISLGFADVLLQRLGPGVHTITLTVLDELGRKLVKSHTVNCS